MNAFAQKSERDGYGIFPHGKEYLHMAKKRYTAVLSVTILMFVAMFAIIGIMASHLLSYKPGGKNIPKDTVIHYDNDNNEVILRPKSDQDVYNFLILGHDRAATLTDVIMLVHYDVTAGNISVVQFPRDTYVSYLGFPNKINASYSMLYHEALADGSQTPELDALRAFADKLEDALCTEISYTAIMNLDGFVNIVNILGGVELNVPADMDYEDPGQDLYIHLKAGYQTLTGEQAEGFVRFRYGYVQGDLGRQDAQKIFLSAFMKKAKDTLSVSNVAKLTSVAEAIIDNIYTDITVSDAVYFVKNLLSVDLSNLRMMSMPCSSSGYNVVMNRAGMLEIISNYFNVYDTPIADSIFDKNATFYTTADQDVVNAYYSDSPVYGGKEYDAGGVNDGDLVIPRAY